MGTRIPSHQLSNGLYVSGRPDQHKERQPTIGSRAVPYTGGDVKKSGELGKMFDIAVVDPSAGGPPTLKPSRHSSSSQHTSGSPTGLITSGPLGSSGSIGGRRSGQLEPSGSMGKAVYGSSVTSLNEEAKFGFKVSKAVMWVFLVVVAMGLLVGAFLMVAVKKAVILVAVAGILVPVIMLVLWNYAWGKRGLLGFLKRYPDAELRGAIDGQYVKVTGVVTCGSIPLESSYQRIPRCVYMSTELYEYRGWCGKSANPKHRFFSWGSRHSEDSCSNSCLACLKNMELLTALMLLTLEKHVADFYISDFQSGLRAMVKAGYGAKVAAFVKPATVVNVTKEKRELSPSFLRWLADRNLSSDDRIMRLKKEWNPETDQLIFLASLCSTFIISSNEFAGHMYIKEGSTVSVMGVVRRHDNVLMIIPPAEPVSTGCQWARCLLPSYVEGLVLMCDDNQNADVVPV
ncbi:putative membrane protein [Vitis vinifera]|uniref:Putative membrane protein n=1 Tax=Vitis vinifera TaxID=29760 RepID=A0A438JG80_VITVI|nr:putative membrane protein [Vitis vinifera]